MTSLNKRPYAQDEPSLLNIATSLRYAACLANGGHKDSGTTVNRDVGIDTIEMMVCQRCNVPYMNGRRPSFNKLTSVSRQVAL